MGRPQVFQDEYHQKQRELMAKSNEKRKLLGLENGAHIMTARSLTRITRLLQNRKPSCAYCGQSLKIGDVFKQLGSTKSKREEWAHSSCAFSRRI